jgi:transportin-1
VRQQAGLILKTIVAKRADFQRLQPPVLSYVVSQLMRASSIGDPVFAVRKTVANVLASVMHSQRTPDAFTAWPQMLPTLVAMMSAAATGGANSSPLVEGATHCISLLCEDCGQRMLAIDGGSPFNAIVPALVPLSGHPGSARVRLYALESLSHIIPLGTAAIDISMEAVLQCLSARTNDPEPRVRVAVCRALSMLVQVRLEFIVGMLGPIMAFFLHATQHDASEDVAKEACNFWKMYCDYCLQAKDALKPVLPQLVPALLGRMVYDADELATLEGVEDVDNAQEKDNARDIAPSFHKMMGRGSTDTGIASSSSGYDDDGDGNGGGGGDDDDDDDDDEFAVTWTLRKAAATALDAISVSFGGHDVLPHFLGPLKQLLSVPVPDDPAQDTNDAWLRVESGILALGCIADGCPQIVGYLDELYPMLLTWASHARPLIRKIALWCMSRYSEWLLRVSSKGAAEAQRYLAPVVQCFCARMCDHTKTVQGSAVSALGVLAQEASAQGRGELLAGLAQPVLQCCAQCLGTYQEINMVILCDTLATVLEACKHRTDIVRHPDFLNMIMPPLIARWNAVDAAAPPGSGGGDPHQFKPLLEGLTSVAVAVGPAFEPFAPPVFKKCLDIIETTLIVMLSGHDGMGGGVGDPMEMGDYIDFDPMCVALDLIAGIAEGVGAPCEAMLRASNLLDLLMHCLGYEHTDVQQSAFGVLGEVGKACPGYIVGALGKICPIALAAMERTSDRAGFAGGYTAEGEDAWGGSDDEGEDDMGDDVTNVCNNAIWSIGEISVKCGPQAMAPFVGPLVLK